MNDPAKRELPFLAHELRNQLSAMKNAIQLIRMQTDQEKDDQFAIDVLSRQIDNMSQTLTELLEFVREHQDLEE